MVALDALDRIGHSFSIAVHQVNETAESEGIKLSAGEVLMCQQSDAFIAMNGFKIANASWN